MELSSTLSLDIFGKPFLLEKRIDLLYAIAKYGSISKAAKSIPMSYKSAWEAIEVMNNLASEPIVESETGGKNGGGTTITDYGLKLLDTYKVLKSEHDRFLEHLSLHGDLQEGTFKTIKRFSMQLSARNQLQGIVSNIETDGINAMVTLQFADDKKLYITVTSEAIEIMHIETGNELTAIFKSNSVRIMEECKEIDNNCLQGTVLQIQNDQELCKVTVNIGEQRSIVAVISSMDAERMQLKEGKRVSLFIKSNKIILGK